MHTTVIIPFCHQGDRNVLQWTLEGFARQELAPGHTLEVLVGIDGGPDAIMALPEVAGIAWRSVGLPKVGAAAVRNALVKQTSAQTDLLVFVNADARPDPGMVQSHADTMAQLPTGSLVLGGAPRERSIDATIFEALIDETPAIFSYPLLIAGSWYNWRAAYTLNLSMRRAQFLASGGFPEELRPLFFEDLVLAYRLIGNDSRVFYQPQARVLHRHPMTLDQYLDREELLGIMAPVLARVAPACFREWFGANSPVETLAQRYSFWVMMDRPLHDAAYHCLQTWAAQPQTRLGDAENRTLMLNALYQLHIPLKRLAFRLGFLRGMQLAEDSQWLARQPQGLWRQALRRR